jgi:hypothetical protein
MGTDGRRPGLEEWTKPAPAADPAAG